MRAFLKELNPIVVKEPVKTRLEVAAYLRKHTQPIVFENVRNYPGFRIVGNLCSSREAFAKSLNTTVANLIFTMEGALDKPMKYQVVEKAGFLKNKVEEPDVKAHIPLLMYYKPKERYYTSATIVLARDPETGRQNASFHRMMYLEGNRFAVRIVPRDLYSFLQKSKEMRRDLDIVVICGSHPAISLAAATSYPNLNELELARVFHEFQCVSIRGIHVPVASEVVMAGRILHDETVDEGPFVDITGTWDIQRKEPVIEVEEIYTQDDPMWQVILPGGAEHRLLMGLPQEPRILKVVRNAVPSVRNVVLTPGGCHWLHAVVSIKKRVEGEGKNAGLAALAAHPSLKRVVVVDDDIDVHDQELVEWAIATRLQPSKGVILIPEAHGSSVDPSGSKTGLTTKWLVDATIPTDLDRKGFMKAEDVSF